MTYQYERTMVCSNCGFTITAKNAGGPMARHAGRCAATPAEVARLVGVDMETPTKDSCWIPTTTTRKGGRAKVSGPNGTERAHIAAFRLANGRYPRHGFIIMHTCDHQNCVNPAHFREGTQADNIRDMVQKGRSRAHGGSPTST